MAYLVAILVALVLFLFFIGITALERKRGRRIFSRSREALDAKASTMARSLRTIDPLDFVIRGARSLFGHIGHDIANVLWASVRMLERTLAGTVRKLRTMRHHETRKEAASETPVATESTDGDAGVAEKEVNRVG